MSRRDDVKRIEIVKRNERTPLLNSNILSESIADKSVQLPDLQSGVSWGVAAFLLVNTALGAGMLNYPYAYNQIGGVLAAALMQIVLLVFITSTMFILVYCADFNQDDTYHDVLLSMCGKRAQQISAVSILLTCYGINITFLVIIGDQYDRIFNSLLSDYTEEYWVLDRKFTIFLTSVLFIWPMCYAQRLDFLRHASILGMFAMLYVAFLTVYEHFKLDEATVAAIVANKPEVTSNSTIPKADHPLRYAQWFESLAIVPVLCFAYQTHEVIVPVYSCMKERFISHFMKASVFGLIILFFLYNLVGAYGYLTFGDNVGADIMSLYDAKDPVVVIGIVALVIKFITTYPPLMFCGRGALDGLYGEFRKLSSEEFKSSERTRRIVITTLWFFSTVALAVFAPDISVTLQLLGSMASINVFVFPGMCLVSLTRRLRRARKSLLIDETNDQSQQRAMDYHLISGSYFGAIKKNAARAESLANNQASANGTGFNSKQNFSATFASLIEFENNISYRSSEYANGRQQSQNQQKLNGYGTQFKHQRRHDEFEKFITSGGGHAAAGVGSATVQDHCGPIGINESHDDFSDCDVRNQKGDIISPIVVNNYHNTNCACITPNDLECYISYDKDRSIDRSARSTTAYNNSNFTRNQCFNNSWNNRSTTGSILDRLGSSIAPTTVAQIGISRFVATGLYLFSALLILFGAFIFVLELVKVFGFL